MNGQAPPKLRRAMDEDAVPVAVGDVAAFGMRNDAAAAEPFDFGPIGLRGKMVRNVEAAQFGDVVIARHGKTPDDLETERNRIRKIRGRN